MGRLAKFGIIRGKTVPVEGLLRAVPRPLDQFSRDCLACFGFAHLAEKAVQGEDFSSDEIEILITKASMPVLLKLVELKRRAEEPVQVEPVLALPVERWLEQGGPERVRREAVQLLGATAQYGLHLVIDLPDFRQLDSFWPEVLAEIRGCRADLSVVGPSVERVVGWLSLHESSKNRSMRAYRVERILAQLKQLGFDRLRESSYRSSLRVMNSVGFTSDVLTRLDRFATPSLCARELYKLNKLTQAHPVAASWSPGVILDHSWSVPQHSGLDLIVMRALAVGAVVLNYIPRRRACAAYLSLPAIQLCARAGGSGPLYGAVDAYTAAALTLHPFDLLQRAVVADSAAGSR